MKTGQVTGDDKNSRISDVENFALITLGADAALKEFLGPRADNMKARAEMTRDIHRDGYVSQKSLSDDIKDKQAVNTLDVFFTSAGIMTDLLTPGLAFRYTEDNKKRKKTVHEQFD